MTPSVRGPARALSRAAVVLGRVLLYAACAFGCSRSQAPPTRGPIAVAAASDLKFALEELGAEFRKENPELDLGVSYGSSGNFFAQLSQGAPFDLFLSADVGYPDRLIQAGVGAGDSRFVYAIGRLAIWVRNGSALDPRALGARSLEDPSVKKIAIANPEHAPYGKAAVAALEKLGLYATLRERLVFGENVAQAAQFAESGAADAGIIALSLAVSPKLREKGSYWELPPETYPRMEQGGVVMARAKNAAAARTLRAFMSSERGAAILRSNGFFLPPK
jgi:molybdate transport system substrate-binding protein